MRKVGSFRPMHFGLTQSGQMARVGAGTEASTEVFVQQPANHAVMNAKRLWMVGG